MTQHIIHFKRSSENISFEAPEPRIVGNAFLPSVALVPLCQHAGRAANPVVSIGDRVREGQLIARSGSPDSSNVHSPIPGIVRRYCTVPLPDGTMGKAAEITLSGSFDILGRKEPRNNWRQIPDAELLKILDEKGVINTFDQPLPLSTSLRKAKKDGSVVIAVRLFDYDPTCLLDSFMVADRMDEILEGTALLSKSVDAKTVVFIHDSKKWNIPDSRDLSQLFGTRKVVALRSGNRYPFGNSVCLSSLVLSSPDIPDGSVPVFIDPITAISALEAVVKNQPILYRYLLVSGAAVGNASLLKVRIGTTIGDIIEECGGFRDTPSRIVVNGLLTGIALYDLDTPVTKTTKSLHIMDYDTCPDYTVNQCIHCGRCLQVCPVRIDPMRVVTGIRKGKITDALIDSIRSCQYCGCCAMVCPSRIPLHHIIREAGDKPSQEKGSE